MRLLFTAITFFLALNIRAEINPEVVVKSFGEALSSWCSTNDISYREKIDALCSGPKSCRVEDKIHAEYQKKRGLTNYETFVLDSYMNMFQTLLSQNVKFQMTNVKYRTSDIMPDGLLQFVTADVFVSGPINHDVTNLFLVRDGKITGIYPYSSKLGFSHLNGSLITALKIGRYSWTGGFAKGYAKVSNESKKQGLIDLKGNVIIPCMWEAIAYEHDGTFARGFNYTSNSNKMDVSYDLRNGKRVPFNAVTFVVGREKNRSVFYEGLAVVYSKVNGEIKYGYIREDDSNYENIEYIFDDASRFINGYAYVDIKGNGFIINRDFEIVLRDNEFYHITNNVRDGVVEIRDRKSGKYGFLTISGKKITDCIYNRTGFFSNGICLVSREGSLNINIDKEGKHESFFGPLEFINDKGKILSEKIFYVPPRAENYSFLFEDNHIPIFKEGKDGNYIGTIADSNGNPLPGFSWEKYSYLGAFHDGLALFVKKDGTVGYYDKSGHIAINLSHSGFYYGYIFKNGYANVSKKINGVEKYGCINKEGILVVPCIYDKEFYFEDGIALVYKEDKVGLIDIYGNSTLK